MSNFKTIAIDFDGVVHKYSRGYGDGSIYDVPVEGAFEYIKSLMSFGYNVYIFSTRNPRQIEKWLNKELWCWDSFSPNDQLLFHGYKAEVIPFWKKFWNKPGVLGISKRKLPALAYIDDRAIKFDGSWENTQLALDKIVKRKD